MTDVDEMIVVLEALAESAVQVMGGRCAAPYVDILERTIAEVRAVGSNQPVRLG
jgi:hypothetical protein